MLRIARHIPSWGLLHEIDLSYNKIECLDVLAAGTLYTLCFQFEFGPRLLEAIESTSTLWVLYSRRFFRLTVQTVRILVKTECINLVRKTAEW